MKKILLTTSALVAMSSVAVAGDIPAAPMAPVSVDGFTVTATGEATIFGFYNGTPAATQGIGGSYELTLKAEKTLDNGAEVSVEGGIEDGSVSASIGYKSSVGEIKAGVIDNDDHGVEVPGAPDTPEVPDEDELTFASKDLSLYTAFAPAALSGFGTADIAITYASPELGGFQFGVGVNGSQEIDVALAGSFATGGATVKVGAGISGAAATISTTGTVTAGASVEMSGFTVGANATHALATSVTGVKVGAAYATGPFSLGASYDIADVSAADTGTIGAGAEYSEGDLTVGVEATFAVPANTYTTTAGFTYKLDAATVGATVGYDGTTVEASAGVDYALNSNVTVGAGVGYDGTNFGGAAGVKVSF
jgi:hypothetical protein